MCFDFSYRLNAPAKTFDGINKYIRITDIDENGKYNDNSVVSPDVNITHKDLEKYHLEEGDMLFARTGASVGKAYLHPRSADNMYYAGFLIRAKANYKDFAEFIFQHTHTQKYKRFVLVTSQRSGQPGINAKEYGNFKFYVPSAEEIILTGNLLRKLDNMISDQEERIKKLKEIKSSYLHYLFASGNQRVPTLRFTGFIEEWEQVKLGNICEFYSGGTPKSSVKEFYSGDIPFIRSGEIHEESTALHLSNQGLEKSSAKMVEKGDILYALYGATAGEVSLSKIDGAINQAILAIKPFKSCQKNVLVHILAEKKNNIVSKYLQGGQGNLSAKIIEKIEITIPESSAEINSISRLLDRIDGIIENQENKLQRLQLLKEGYLQKLFV